MAYEQLGIGAYSQKANNEVWDKAKSKFEKATTELAGKDGFANKVKKSLARADYNFARWATMKKNAPKAKAAEAAILKKMQGNQR